MKILTAAQMRQVDDLTTRRYGVSGLLLMENAAFRLCEVLHARFPAAKRLSVAILCGQGNNGGDGLALARQLLQRDVRPDVYLFGDAAKVKREAKTNLQILEKMGHPVRTISSRAAWRKSAPVLQRYDVIVDALFGTGLARPLAGLHSDIVEAINSSGSYVLSVDIPSGMPSDSTTRIGPIVRADCTVTFTAPKVAHILHPDQEALGQLVIVPIGSPPSLLNEVDCFLEAITPETTRPFIPKRPVASHKGTFGHVGLICGSRGKSGAAHLAARAALRAGSGLVTMCLPETLQPALGGSQSELMSEGFAALPEGAFSFEAADPLLEWLQERDAAGIGPGLGTRAATVQFVQRLISRSPVPLIVDADALNAYAGRPGELRNCAGHPLILTPHPGELSRLTGIPVNRILEENVRLARDFAQQHQLWVVLKGFRTLVADPAGSVRVCPLGNSGMASAGMGDVLTGILTSLVGQLSAQGHTTPEKITEAVSLGVFLHSLCGDLAAAEVGPAALTAGDVISRMGEAFQKLSADSPA